MQQEYQLINYLPEEVQLNQFNLFHLQLYR